MKILVFAHTPPPHHGQSYMVQLMLEGFGGDRRSADRGSAPPGKIECYHVNCRYSDSFEDIGSFRFVKIWLVLRYCLEAIWCRFRYGVRAFYYVPAPGKRAALYRDWVVMLVCRPFFRHFIHHWHAVGLGDWLHADGSWFERWVTHRLLGRCSLGIALAISSMRDALWFRSRSAEIVANGIPDPCPNFENAVLPRRRARTAVRRNLLSGKEVDPQDFAAAGAEPEVLHVLYLAHCMRTKGVFDALDGVALGNAKLRGSGTPLRLHLTIAGSFPDTTEEVDFQARVAEKDLAGDVSYVGFADEEKKGALLAMSDVLCFPTYYHAESFGLVIVEAMAAGLAIVSTRWRAIPEILPPDYPGFVAPRSPEQVAERLFAAAVEDGTGLRELFLARYSLAKYVDSLREVICAVGADGKVGVTAV